MTEYQHLNTSEMTCIRYLMSYLTAASVFDKRASPEFLCDLVDIPLKLSINAENKKIKIVPELKKLKKLIVKEGHSIDDLARVAKKLLNSDSCRDNSFGEELDYAVRPYKNPESYRWILQKRQKFQSGRCMATHY